MRKRAYATVSVKAVNGRDVRGKRLGEEAVVGVDAGKGHHDLVVRWQDRSFERPRRIANPGEIGDAIRWLNQLREGGPVRVALESSGTYAEPLRQALTDAGFPVEQVGTKASHDYAELFDGVPSQHDGKDAAIVAELAAIGKSWPWPMRTVSAWEDDLAMKIDILEIDRRARVGWLNRLEALLASHWPEATRLVKLSSSSLLHLLAQYGGPAAVADTDAKEVRRRMHNWSRGSLPTPKIDALLEAARISVGVRQNESNRRRMQYYAEEALTIRRRLRKAARDVRALVDRDRDLRRLADTVGAVTAGVLWSKLGNPRDYASAGAYRKAMGLNLTERSSGFYQGTLRISRRGPASVRHWLYLAALRQIRQVGVRDWYEAKKARDGRAGHPRAMVGVMRRLAVAIHRVVCRHEEFDPARLFAASSGAPRSKKASRR